MNPISKLLDLSDKTALVTGGARGIGLGIVKRLAEAGANVFIADLDADEAKNSARALADAGLRVAAGSKIDVSNEADVKQMVEECVAEFGALNILVNNAGIYPPVPVEEMTPEEFDKVIAVNLKGVFLGTKYGAAQMIKQKKGGKIINITSIDALHPSSVGLAHYDASKHGVWGFTKNTALELAPYKIQVNAIAPGAILTPGVKDMKEGKKISVGLLAKIPMKRLGEVDDIGKATLFLASDLSSYMTGSQVIVDGGMLLS